MESQKISWVNIDFSKINDTLSKSKKQAFGYNLVIWDCDKKEVKLIGKHKLFFK